MGTILWSFTINTVPITAWSIKALSWAAQNYAGWDLYRHLRDELGMSNEEIGKAGFDLDEFYEVEAADSAEYEVEADYGEEL